MERLWYAVQRDAEDDWGTGSFDIFEARAMLIKQGFGLIAVIENDTCIEELTYEDTLDFWNGIIDEFLRNEVEQGGSAYEMLMDGYDGDFDAYAEDYRGDYTISQREDGTLLIHRIGYDEVYTTDGKAVWYD